MDLKRLTYTLLDLHWAVSACSTHRQSCAVATQQVGTATQLHKVGMHEAAKFMWCLQGLPGDPTTGTPRAEASAARLLRSSWAAAGAACSAGAEGHVKNHREVGMFNAVGRRATPPCRPNMAWRASKPCPDALGLLQSRWYDVCSVAG